MRSKQKINILWVNRRLSSKRPMSRLLCLCFPLLFALALSVFAQSDAPPPGRANQTLGDVDAPLSRDPALLMRMREQISLELQQTQRMLGIVNPNDPLVETLKTQQTDLTKQLLEITQQMQTAYQSSVPAGRPTMPTVPMREAEGKMPGPLYTPMEVPTSPRQPVIPIPLAQPNSSDMTVPMSPFPVPVQPYSPNPSYNVPNWADQDRAWEATPWGPKLPKELTDMKQSIDSLQKEIGALKDTIKALETQIQLLSRNILLNEKMKENGN